VRIFSGEDAVLDVAAFVPALAERYAIQAAVFDPWRAGQMARGWAQRGIQPVDFPQHDYGPRQPSALRRHRRTAVVHPDDPELNRHVAAAVARHGRRGWRIDKAERGENIDAVVALAMAAQVAQARPEPVKLLGWL
jgi:phage terminase large subunit-like protein